jgi:hypothetical protein
MKHKGQLNRLIIDLVERGRERCRTPLLKWSQLMLGAAMTMQTLYADDPNVPKRVSGIVKKAMDTFEPCQKYATRMFPDITEPKAEQAEDGEEKKDKKADDSED